LNPIVSILIPTYNRVNYLKNTLKKINLAKNKKFFEIIIINDGSSDSTKSFLKKVKFKNIKKINLKKNSGRSFCLLKGIIQSRGKFIMFLDDDDIIYKKSINIIIKNIQRFPFRYCFVYDTSINNFNKYYSKKKEFNSYIELRSSLGIKKDLKEIVISEPLKKIAKKYLPNMYQKRIPTGLLFAKLSLLNLKWKYIPIALVKKRYLKDGITLSFKKNIKSNIDHLIKYYEIISFFRGIKFLYRLIAFVLWSRYALSKKKIKINSYIQLICLPFGFLLNFYDKILNTFYEKKN
jgi:glycosyltransferase involved in cell wall biosynthesis